MDDYLQPPFNQFPDHQKLNPTQKIPESEPTLSNQKTIFPQTRLQKTTRKNLRLFSEAYPSSKQGQPIYQSTKVLDPNDKSVGQKKKVLQPQVQSQVHEKLLKINFTHQQHTEPIHIRQFQIKDLPQLKKLQQEWFPIRYSEEFYKKIIRKQCYCLVAETLIKIPLKILQNQENSIQFTEEKVLIGAAVFQLTDSAGYAHKSWTDTFFNLFKNSQDSIYIMTLGVIDEFRKKGVGKLLIEEIGAIANQWKSVKLIYLHVISYNNAAIKFYKKIGFQMLEDIQNFYHVGGEEFGGQVHGMFVNGGRNNGKWSQWLRKLIH